MALLIRKPRRARAGLAVALVLTSATTGCGDALLDDQFRGTPIWQLKGEIRQGEEATADLSALRVALFWSPGGAQENVLERYVEQTTTSVPISLTLTYVLNVFQPPGPEHQVQAQVQGQAAGATYAVGRLLAYTDTNRNRRRDADEPIVGQNPPRALLWAAAPLDAGQSPTRNPLPAGFSTVLLPQRCDAQLPATTPGTCGVPIGSACKRDADCGGGVCLNQTTVSWQGGTCAVPEPSMDGCRPQDSSFVWNAPMPMGTGPSGFYVQRCTRDADCARRDRGSGDYVCDIGQKACVPVFPDNVSLGVTNVFPFCGALNEGGMMGGGGG